MTCFFISFFIGGLIGGAICYSGVKQYRKQLGLNPDPFYIYQSEVEVINRVKKWTKGRKITKDKLREFLNKLKEEYVGKI